MGNAMGLVRLMRAGCMHYCAAAVRQLPVQEELQPFTAAAEQLSDASEAHLAAAQTLDDAVNQPQGHTSNGNLTILFGKDKLSMTHKTRLAEKRFLSAVAACI